MATVTQCERAYAALISAFGEAMVETMKPRESLKGIRLTNAAFDLAEEYGWDWTNDQKWTRWSSKATGPELLAHGLAFAIQKARL